MAARPPPTPWIQSPRLLSFREGNFGHELSAHWEREGDSVTMVNRGGLGVRWRGHTQRASFCS